MASINITEYKMAVLRDLFNNPEIVTLIDSQDEGFNRDEPDSLIYRNIWPYLRIPDTITVSDCHILIAVDITAPSRYNPTYAKYLTTIWCLCHQERMRVGTRTGTRIDLLSEEVKKMFDGEMKFGFGEYQLLSNREIILNEKFQYRELKFECNDLRHKVTPEGKRHRQD